MRKRLLALAALVVATLSSAGPAGAITFGQLDGNRHPNVGALIAEWREPGQKDLLCSGTLIAPDVFLTASHCTAFLASLGIAPDEVWVTFDPVFGPDATLHAGTYHTHPDFGFSGPGGFSDPHDIAVVVLDEPVAGIAPAVLPPAGLLDTMKASKALRSATFTAVGYGTVRETKRRGPHAFFFDATRRFALQSFLALRPAWLSLSMQPSTGDGGTCFGDSGGPHFLGGVTSNLIVSITVSGDAMCRATDVTYRLDTTSARAFLDDFVALP